MFCLTIKKHKKTMSAPSHSVHQPFRSGSAVQRWWVRFCPLLAIIKYLSQECCEQGQLSGWRNPRASLWPLQVVAFHQATGRQGAGLGEEGRLHVQPSLCQSSVAAGGGTHLLGLGEVRLLPLSWGQRGEGEELHVEITQSQTKSA